jgi:tRNA A37 threonylcarbamoyladenosine dehydratase
VQNKFSRTEMLFGADAMEKLSRSKVAVFGIGGVGGYAVEALARGGVGVLGLFDGDVVDETNINRQIHATTKTIGQYKVEAAKERALEINPDIEVTSKKLFFLPETSGEIDFAFYDYIIDAIDTITGKIELVLKAREYKVPIICSMAAGNKVEPAAFKGADIYETSICPIAKVIRRELKKFGIEKLKVVYSTETPLTLTQAGETEAPGRKIPGSNSFVPPAAGCVIAGEVIKDLIGYGEK